MPNIASAEKRLRQSIKRNLFNRAVKSRLNTLKKKTIKLIEANDKKGALEAFGEYSSALDKAARRSIIHQNRASVKKSDMMKKINLIK